MLNGTTIKIGAKLDSVEEQRLGKKAGRLNQEPGDVASNGGLSIELAR